MEEGNRDQLVHQQVPHLSSEELATAAKPSLLKPWAYVHIQHLCVLYSHTGLCAQSWLSPVQGQHFVPISHMRTLRSREVKSLG